MNERFVDQIAKELKIQPRQVAAVALLLKQDATIPFIARYRKEMTGSLDEVVITSVRDRMEQLQAVASRREAIAKSLAERNLLTDTLTQALSAAETLTALEDIYQPFRPKRRTRAMIAREKGLEPLAELLWAQDGTLDPTQAAAAFVSVEKDVASTDLALAGARDILAERISDDTGARTAIRKLFATQGVLRSKVMTGKEVEGAKFKDYFDWSEPITSAPSHRVLAIRRGEAEGFLLTRLTPPEADAIAVLRERFVKNAGPAAQQVQRAVDDGYQRLMEPSLETEARLEAKDRADLEAIRVFAANLRELLLTSPLGRKNVLAIDPGFRTGCKVVCLDRQGKLLHNDVIYVEQSERARAEAQTKVLAYIKHFQIEAVAIGNGTAGRETEAFVRSLGLPASIVIVSVNESGASVYSASAVAREEFPEHDLTVRGAVSIGRRLMDPLAELVKIDPKAIGVGQYQHDVDQSALKKSLDDVVTSCVNAVGVEVNTASKELLSYVSGLNAVTATNVVSFRNSNGPFRSRQDLAKVPRLGPKAFEQAAGFLRIRDGQNPLDASAVHPERYVIVEQMAADHACTVTDLMKRPELRQKIAPERYVNEQVGLPTLKDILEELAKPGRDPREAFEAFAFAEGVAKLEDLKPGMKLPGIVTNVTAFGAFVDIGVHQDGLVHVSQLADHYVKDPAEVVKVQQRVQVTVLEVDLARKRVALSMKSKPEAGAPRGQRTSPGAGPSPSRPPAAPRMPTNDWFSAALDKTKKR
ncbi:MAG: RNA-binding transcriptional accessory protein [Lentisphaerae bacterium]|nr:RNA-binding transcriptional accessory protein [Lentisphaerota bacterium]